MQGVSGSPVRVLSGAGRGSRNEGELDEVEAGVDAGAEVEEDVEDEARTEGAPARREEVAGAVPGPILSSEGETGPPADRRRHVDAGCS